MFNYPSHKICIAPMMDYTDRHFRYLMRIISKHSLLFTEMVTTSAIIHGDVKRLLTYSKDEQPLVAQIGGRDLNDVVQCVKVIEDFGYNEINLNVGCPSSAVKSGKFGASLMLEPDLVASLVSAMVSHTKLPISIKCRLGVDDIDSYEFLKSFVTKINSAGCSRFYVHARKALLNGISPKQNRTIPPLCYDKVYALKKDFPHVPIILNGGVNSNEDIEQHLSHVDGVMIGRASYKDPYLFSTIDQKHFDSDVNVKSREDIALEYLDYVDSQSIDLAKINCLTKHLQGLWFNQRGASHIRKKITDPNVTVQELRQMIDGIII